MRFQETLRRLAMIDEGFVEDQARLGLGLVSTSALDPKTAALLQVGVLVAMGSSAVCLEWSTGRALAAGATEDGSSPPRPMWRPHSGMTSRPRWKSRTVINSSSKGHVNLSTGAENTIPGLLIAQRQEVSRSCRKRGGEHGDP